MNTGEHFPITAKRALELLGLFLLGYILWIGSGIIMPILMAFFLSIMLLPVYRVLKRWRLPEVLAILLPILSLLIILGGLIWFFSSQIQSLISDFPQIRKNINIHLTSLSEWVKGFTHYSTQQQIKFLDQQSNKFLSSTGNLLSGILGSVSGTIVFFGLLPIYIFLILSYKNLLLKFCIMWFGDKDIPKVKGSLKAIEDIIQSYLMGLIIQILYITVLLGGILLLVGIKHALLIGVLFALLNLIPYIGALIGNILGVMLTISSSQELWPIFTVLIVIAAVQFLDNNILMPRIVGSKVKINSLIAILGIVIAGTLAGISGMFLALPIIAVLKIIFDRTEYFKQWGVLLSDDVPETNPLNH